MCDGHGLTVTVTRRVMVQDRRLWYWCKAKTIMNMPQRPATITLHLDFEKKKSLVNEDVHFCDVFGA